MPGSLLTLESCGAAPGSLPLLWGWVFSTLAKGKWVGLVLPATLQVRQVGPKDAHKGKIQYNFEEKEGRLLQSQAGPGQKTNPVLFLNLVTANLFAVPQAPAPGVV